MEDLKISTSVSSVHSLGFGIQKLSISEIRAEIQNVKHHVIRGNILNKETFNVLCSTLTHFSDIDAATKSVAWQIIKRACKNCSSHLARSLGTSEDGGWSQTNTGNREYLEVLKMSTYLIIQMSLLYYSAQKSQASLALNKTKKKSAAVANSGFDLDIELEAVLQFQLVITDLDIYKLWKDKIVEEDFVNQMSDLCYTFMEDQNVMKNKILRPLITQVLGSLIKKYGQSVSAALKVSQLLQNFDHLALPLAEALKTWTESFKCQVVGSEILRELSQIPEKDLSRDSTNTKSITTFISEVGRLLPSTMRANMSMVVGRMEEESYTMRNTVVDCMKEVVISCLSKEDGDDKMREERDHMMEILFEHAASDVNAFVRSRAVNAITALVKASAIPIMQSQKVHELGKKLVLDKSNLVRKSTIMLLTELIKQNPFASKLRARELTEGFANECIKLKELEAELQAATSSSATSKTATVAVEAGDSTKDTDSGDDNNDDQDSSKENEEMEVDDVVMVGAGSKSKELLDKECKVERQKEVVTYLGLTVAFVDGFHQVYPTLCDCLRSKFHTDVLEAIDFFVTAFKFQLDFAMEGVQVMLDQIWSEDAKTKDAVVSAYKELYFSNVGEKRIYPIDIVNNMVALISKLSDSNWDSFQHLLVELRKIGVIPYSAIQLMWNDLEKASTNDADPARTTTIIQLLGMISTGDPAVLKGKVELLVRVGLKYLRQCDGDDERFDFTRAKFTSIAFSKLSPQDVKAGRTKKQARYDNDHVIIKTILDLVIKGFPLKSTNYVLFAMEAIGVLFSLSKLPILLSTKIFYACRNTVVEAGDNEYLTRFFSICGQLALKTLVFVESDVLSEINRRKMESDSKANETAADKKKKKRKQQQQLQRSARKNKSAMASEFEDDEDEEEGDGSEHIGIDDSHAEQIAKVLEEEVVAPDRLLGSAAPLMVKICSMTFDRDDHSSVRVQQSASLALAKYMMVSRKFCADHLRLFFTMLETSPHEGVRSTLLVASSDLCIRHPNQLEPWNSRIYNRLNDASDNVRIHALKVLTTLVLSDMIKVKGHVSEIARCIVDKNEKLKSIARRFFSDLSKKGNSLYNVIPDIISRLSEASIDEEDYRMIMKFLFEFISKDKQAESLIEKLCHRFKATREREQWRSLAYCLTLLAYTEKGFKKLLESFSFYSDSLGDFQIFESFKLILAKLKKLGKPEIKLQVEEFESKVNEKHEQGKSDDECANKAATATQQQQQQQQTPKKTSQKKFAVPTSVRKRKQQSDESDEHDDDDDDNEEEEEMGPPAQTPPRRVTRSRRQPATQKVEFSDSSDEDDDDDGDDDDLSNESKENDGVDDEEEDEVNAQLKSIVQAKNLTPIQRKPTPKRRSYRALLRA